MEHTLSRERVQEILGLLSIAGLRDLIAEERLHGRAFGPLAEAARHELARRGEQA